MRDKLRANNLAHTLLKVERAGDDNQNPNDGGSWQPKFMNRSKFVE